MHRLTAAVLLLAAAAPARAHFVWILPPEKPGQPARVVFSDTPRPDNPELLKKIAHTELFVLGENGQATPLHLTEAKDAFDVSLPPGRGCEVLGGVCRYGVTQRGQVEPFLLIYYSKAVVDFGAGGESLRKALGHASEKLPLQVVADGNTVRVLWQGKPVAGAEVTAHIPGQEKPAEGKTDADGSFTLPRAGAAGIVGVRAGHVENTAGELDGKKYKSVKHYATLTYPVREQAASAAGAENGKAESPGSAKLTEDRAATKLLADARAARANWQNFPGFTADLEVNFDGKVEKGRATVDPQGKVTVQVSNPAASAWAKRMLGSIVAHRTDDGSDLHTPCAFADDVTDHPLGRAIRVLNDEFHSSYRIRDRQVIEVNRVMKDARFTITVIENRLNADKQYLPATYVVNYWDLKTGALQRAEAHEQTWQHVGRFDLPLGATVVTSLPGKQEAKALRLTNIHLAEPTR